MFDDAKLISNLTRGTVVCDRAWAADRPLSRMRRLLGRRALAPGEGLLWQPAPSIHAAAMRFPIDVVFLDREFRVVKVVNRLRPWPMATDSQTRSALELPAGEAEARRISVGDQFAVQDRRIDFVDRIDPIGVLLISEDPCFRAVAGELLRHRGFKVTTEEGMTGIPRRAACAGADVVVLDADATPNSVVAETVAITKFCHDVRVVVLSTGAPTAGFGARVLAKWGSIDALHRAIDDARLDRTKVSW